MNEFAKRFIEMGHDPVLNEDGEVDMFAYTDGVHNGPMCEKCYCVSYECCDHISEIKKCISNEEAVELRKGLIEDHNESIRKLLSEIEILELK